MDSGYSLEILSFRATTENRGNNLESEATVKIKVGSIIRYEAGNGNSIIYALFVALGKALLPSFPDLQNVCLDDWRIIASRKNVTALAVFSNGTDKWTAHGRACVNEVEAIFSALVDGFEEVIKKTACIF